MEALEELHSLGRAHKNLLIDYNRYNATEMEYLYTQMKERMPKQWVEQYHLRVDTSPDGNGNGEFGKLGLESLLKFMEKLLQDWRADQLYSLKNLPRSKIHTSVPSKHAKGRSFTAQGEEEEQSGSETSDEDETSFVHKSTQKPKQTKKPQPKPKKAFVHYDKTDPAQLRGQYGRKPGQRAMASKIRRRAPTKPKPAGCPCCGSNHEVYECKAFKGLILKQKRDIVEYAELVLYVSQMGPLYRKSGVRGQAVSLW
jgi:hypothetical protein